MTTEKLIVADSATISLTRFKELEEIERIFLKREEVVVSESYYSKSRKYLFLSKDEATEEIKKEIADLKRSISDYNAKTRRLDYIERSWWFKRIKPFLKDLRYL